MKTGIIYYSRTGNTKQAAETIEKKLKNKKIDVKLFEIKHVKKPGFFKAGYAAMRQKELPIIDVDFDLKKYDLLLFGSPIWAGKPAPFIKTFINKIGKTISGKKTMVFLTCSSKPDKYVKAAKIVSKYLEKNNIKTTDTFLILKMKKKQIIDGEQNIDNFVETITSS